MDVDLPYLAAIGLPIVASAATAAAALQKELEKLAAVTPAKASPGVAPKAKAAAVAPKELKKPAAVAPAKASPGIAPKAKAAAVASKALAPPSPATNIDEAVQAVLAEMKAKAASAGLHSSQFLPVEPGYYDQPLEWRCQRLGASSVNELCKSVVLENTRMDDSAEPQRIRRVLVIVQYVAKLHKEKLSLAVRGMETLRGLPVMGKKQYNMRLLEGEACAKLTGFEHNAVTPLGLDLPIILSDEIAHLPSATFWLGGGHVDLKLRLSVEEVKSVLGAVVADVTG